MEKNITLQQSDIRVINAKQVQTSALLDGMKKEGVSKLTSGTPRRGRST